MRKCRVDNNQALIVKQLRLLGAVVLHTHTLKNAFDILVGYNKKLYMIEIKKDKKGKLTAGEQKCKEMFESVGVPYYIIYNIEQFIELINTK